MTVAGMSYLMSVKKDHTAEQHDGCPDRDCGKMKIRREDDMPQYEGLQGPNVVRDFRQFCSLAEPLNRYFGVLVLMRKNLMEAARAA